MPLNKQIKKLRIELISVSMRAVDDDFDRVSLDSRRLAEKARIAADLDTGDESLVDELTAAIQAFKEGDQ